jgi:hypothetical protein
MRAPVVRKIPARCCNAVGARSNLGIKAEKTDVVVSLIGRVANDDRIARVELNVSQTIFVRDCGAAHRRVDFILLRGERFPGAGSGRVSKRVFRSAVAIGHSMASAHWGA